MGFFSFLKYTSIIFAAHLATSCGAPFENHCCNLRIVAVITVLPSSRPFSSPARHVSATHNMRHAIALRFQYFNKV
jgi:hypothetical protein